MTHLALDVSLFCRNPAGLLAFYQALLGPAELAPDCGPIHCALRLGPAELGFNKTDAHALLGLADRFPGDDGIQTFATFQVTEEAEVDAIAGRVSDLGGRVVKGPHRTWYNAWQVVAADPEGNVFRLNHRG